MKRALTLIIAFLLLAVCIPSGAFSIECSPDAELLRFNADVVRIVKEYSYIGEKDGEAYSTARIIVGCEDMLELSGALAHARGCGRYLIQYRTPEEAKAAAEHFKTLSCVGYVVPDAPVAFDCSVGEFDSARQQPGVNGFKSWGFGENYMNAFAYNEWLLESVGGNADALPEIIVAVIDTGLEYDHPFFEGRTVPGWDFGDNDGDTGGGFYHGTHVAGTVVDGTLPNVKIMGLKCTDDYGGAMTSVIINCIQYAYQHGAHVANVSMGEYFSETVDAYASVINAAANAGMVTCVASGNDNLNVSYCCPACIERAFTVAAHDRDFNMWSGSNYGDFVDVTAPGVDIVSAMPNGGYQAQTGTSMASPHAAAACAMLKSRDPEMSADEIMSAIKNAAVDRGIAGGGTGVLCMTALIGEITIIPGDADGSGSVDVADALLALRYSMGLIDAAQIIISAADINQDGTVTVSDAIIILRKAMGFEASTLGIRCEIIPEALFKGKYAFHICPEIAFTSFKIAFRQSA
ncbi:MAG: S8 family serine peptidase [Clostridia bacterium]|nr:S8 family serine peptidase [Clostridia bacterium]